jgi:hypothetical protein
LFSDQFPAIGSVSMKVIYQHWKISILIYSSHRSSLMCSIISNQFPAVGSNSMKVIYQYWKISIVIAPAIAPV